LRDDVKALFADLQKHLDSKKILLNSLLKNEKSASDLIKNRNDAEDALLKIIEYATDLIDEINIEDYNISKIKDEISRRYGLDFNKIFRNDFYTSENEIMSFKNEVLLQEEIIIKIIVLKKRNNFLMNKNQDDLRTQISELERMRRIEIIIPKDLQSS
jgi:hypothetical protein